MSGYSSACLYSDFFGGALPSDLSSFSVDSFRELEPREADEFSCIAIVRPFS